MQWEPKLGRWATKTWRLRWSFACLVGLTGCRRKGQSSRESSEQRQKSGIRVRQTDSGPWAGPNRNGPSLSCQIAGNRGTAGRVGSRDPMYPGPGRQPPGAGARPVTPVSDQYTFGIPAPEDPGPARQSPGTGKQPVMDRFTYNPPPRTRT